MRMAMTRRRMRGAARRLGCALVRAAVVVMRASMVVVHMARGRRRRMHMHTGRLRTRTNYYRSTDRYIDVHTGFRLAPHAAERSHASQYQRFKNVFFHK